MCCRLNWFVNLKLVIYYRCMSYYKYWVFIRIDKFVLDKDECSGDFCKNGGMCINSNGFY